MFLDDAFQHFWPARVIPDAFGINDRNRPANADAQAVGLRAKNQRSAPSSLIPSTAALKIPTRPGSFRARNIWFGRVGAKKNVTPEFFDAKRFHGGFQLIGHVRKVAGNYNSS